MNIFKRMHLSNRRTFSLRKEVGAIIKSYSKHFYGLSGGFNNNELTYTYIINGEKVDRLNKLIDEFGKVQVLNELHYWKEQLNISSISFSEKIIQIVKKGKD